MDSTNTVLKLPWPFCLLAMRGWGEIALRSDLYAPVNCHLRGDFVELRQRVLVARAAVDADDAEDVDVDLLTTGEFQSVADKLRSWSNAILVAARDQENERIDLERTVQFLEDVSRAVRGVNGERS